MKQKGVAGKSIVYSPIYRHKDFMSQVSEETRYEVSIKGSATAISKMLRKEGIPCRVLRGNGSTEPAGASKAKNYFVIEPNRDHDNTNLLYLNFDMTDENAKAITEALKKYYIPFIWEGTLGSCFVFHLDKKGVPE